MINHSDHRCGSRGRYILFPFLAIAAALVFGAVVMLLWNGIMACNFGLATLTYWQAVGLLILSKLLFSGWHGCHGDHFRHGHHRDRARMARWWMELSDEERTCMWQEWEKKRQQHEGPTSQN